MTLSSLQEWIFQKFDKLRIKSAQEIAPNDPVDLTLPAPPIIEYPEGIFGDIARASEPRYVSMEMHSALRAEHEALLTRFNALNNKFEFLTKHHMKVTVVGFD
jgi:hypothetical protein